MLEVLERLAVPIIIVLFGAGGAGSVWLSRRQQQPTAPTPLPADAPHPDDDPVAVNTWLLAEVGRMRDRLGDLDRLLEEVPPYVRWWESGGQPPARMLSPRVRKILGLEP